MQQAVVGPWKENLFPSDGAIWIVLYLSDRTKANNWQMENGAKPGLKPFEKNTQLHKYSWDGLVFLSFHNILLKNELLFYTPKSWRP